MSNVFNQKTFDQYKAKPPLFFGGAPGLFDTVHSHYPKIKDLYDKMRSLDWNESEFDYSQCITDFEQCPESVSDIMLRTIAWQWEADSVASRSVAPLLAPFISSSELWAAWQRISDNEVIHAATYSEIIKLGFRNPEKALQRILEIREAHQRLSTVERVFDRLYSTSHRYALGLVTPDEAYDDVFMSVVALYFLERVQFLASFAITFTICSSNWFQPIGKAVQKICQDELEVHAELDKVVILEELKTERGKQAYQRLLPQIQALADDVLNGELWWADWLFSDGRELVGANARLVKDFVLFCAREPYKTLGLTMPHRAPTKNPMPFVENWLNINMFQAAPQEQDNNAYKLNVIIRNDNGALFDVDF